MKAYLAIFRMRLKMETQYRGAVLGGILCQVFFGMILVALYRALYAGKPQSMPLSAIVTYVWLQQAFFRMVLSTNAELADKIRTGAIAYDLCRPLNAYGYYYLCTMAMKLMGSALRAAPMLIFASLLPDGWGIAAPASPVHLLCGIFALVLGLLCVCALENITMAITMRTLDPRGMQAMLNLLMMILSGNILPLTLFPDAWQKVITLLPYAQLLDAPIRLYTGEWALSQFPRVIAIQGIWTATLLFLGLYFWRQNQKHIVLQGG